MNKINCYQYFFNLVYYCNDLVKKDIRKKIRKQRIYNTEQICMDLPIFLTFFRTKQMITTTI